MLTPLLIPYALQRDGLPLYATDSSLAEKTTRSAMRVAARMAKNSKQPALFRCLACDGDVYPRLSRNLRPHWAHIGKTDCPLDREQRLTAEQLDAILYAGRQEGAAHAALVERIRQMAKADPEVIADSVKVNSYLKPAEGEPRGRFPDISFNTRKGSMVIEVQLSPISLHRLAERTLFYAKQDIKLIWVTNRLEKKAIANTWMHDLWAAQGQVIYSVDAPEDTETAPTKFLLRRHILSEGEEQEVGLSDLLPTPWYEDFKQRWAALAGINWADAVDLMPELEERLKLDLNLLDRWEMCHVLNVLIAIEAWKPIGGQVDNPISIVYSFLASRDGRQAADLIERAIEKYRPELFDRPKTREMLKRARDKAGEAGLSQWHRKSPIGRVRDALFPGWSLPSPT